MTLSTKDILKKWEGISQTKAALPVGKALALGALAGLYIAMGALGFTMAQSGIGGGLGKWIGACVFPAGLILVVLAGAELFTGNCLIACALPGKKVSLAGMLRNWVFVYLGNMIGALLAALIVATSHLMDANTAALALSIAEKKCALSFGDALLRGVGCNILVCGAVWMASGTDEAIGKAVCCFFPIMLFVLVGFEHSVANMYYVPVAMLSKAFGNVQDELEQVTVSAYFVKNLLPVTLGNIIGGAGLGLAYACIYHT